MTSHILLVAIATAALVACNPVLAQDRFSSAETLVEATALSIDKIDIVASGGPIDRTGAGFALTGPTGGFVPPKIEILTTTDSTVASIGIGYQSSTARQVEGGFATNSTLFTAKVSAPIAKEKEQTSVFGFTKKGDGETFSLGISQFYGNVPSFVGLRSDENTAMLNCLERESLAWAVDGVDSVEIAKRLELRKVYIALAQTVIPQDGINRLAQLAGSRDDGVEKINAAIGTQCRIKNLQDFLQKYNPAAVETARATSALRTNLLFWAAEATVSRSKLGSLDLAAFDLRSSVKTGYEMTASIGVIGRLGDWSGRVQLSRFRSYEEADAAEFCKQVDASGLTRCLTGPNGPVAKERGFHMSVEYRYQIVLGGSKGLSAAVAPLITYDFKKEAFAFDVPVYFSPNSAGALNGGLRFGYRTDTDDLAVGLFVGLPFSVFY